MGLLRKAWRLFSRPAVRTTVRAKYDAAQTNAGNRKHWANADNLAADNAMTPAVRRILRSRARYEIANNSYAKGIVLTLANDLVGTGPRLQLLGPDRETNVKVEREFRKWAKAINLPAKLRLARSAKCGDGEAFLMLVSNPLLPTAVKLDVTLVEADQIADPSPGFDPLWVDGITYDRWGNPEAYSLLDVHPGASSVMTARRIAAEQMIHYYRQDRPGQHRGLPDLMPALELFAHLRRFTLATIEAAETAANFALFLKTQSAPEQVEAGADLPEVDVERNVAVPLAEGWEPYQLKAEHPNTTYAEFVRCILNEIARCLNMPINVAMGDSSDHSYASGRLDHQTYFLDILVERDCVEHTILDRLFAEWLSEASIKSGYLPQQAREIGFGEDHEWFWDGREHVDPLKEASAQAARLANHTTTLAREWARVGMDWEEQLRQRAAEIALARSLGLPTTFEVQTNAQETKDNGDDGGDGSDGPNPRSSRRAGSQRGGRG